MYNIIIINVIVENIIYREHYHRERYHKEHNRDSFFQEVKDGKHIGWSGAYCCCGVYSQEHAS